MAGMDTPASQLLGQAHAALTTLHTLSHDPQTATSQSYVGMSAFWEDGRLWTYHLTREGFAGPAHKGDPHGSAHRQLARDAAHTQACAALDQLHTRLSQHPTTQGLFDDPRSGHHGLRLMFPIDATRPAVVEIGLGRWERGALKSLYTGMQRFPCSLDQAKDALDQALAAQGAAKRHLVLDVARSWQIGPLWVPRSAIDRLLPLVTDVKVEIWVSDDA